jgi:hypothetical protein
LIEVDRIIKQEDELVKECLDLETLEKVQDIVRTILIKDAAP